MDWPDLTEANARVCNYYCGDCGHTDRAPWSEHNAHHGRHLSEIAVPGGAS